MRNAVECRDRREAIAACVMGDLDSRSALELEQHIAHCDTCRGVRDALAAEESVVRSVFQDLARSLGPAGRAIRHVGERQGQVKTRAAISACFPRGVRQMIWGHKRISIAAAVLAAIGLTAAVMLLDRSTGIAFADVQKQILAAKSASWTLTMRLPNGSRLSFRVLTKEPGLIRHEKFQVDGNAVDGVNIYDLAKGKVIELRPSQKLATERTWGEEPPVVGVAQRSGVLGAGSQDFLASVKKLIEGTSQPLGEKDLKGRKAKGFRITKSDKVNEGSLKEEMNIWVDAKTGQPITIDILNQGGSLAISDIVLDEQLDESLFSLEIPVGYTVKKILSPMESATEKDLLGGLKVWADLNEGAFPRSVTQIGDDLTRRLNELPKQKIYGNEISAVYQSITEMVYFATARLKMGEFSYFGQGVKYGDAKTPILWYRDKGQEKYRVIYGDLNVKDLAKEELPATPPARPPFEH